MWTIYLINNGRRRMQTYRYLDIIKLTIKESSTLSDSTKKEVLQWFLTANGNISRADLDNSSDKQWKTENANIYIDVIKLTVHESNTFSDSTKKEVLQWFLTANGNISRSDLDNSSDKQWNTKNANIYLDIIKLTVHESNTFSDSTKKEVLQWFLTANGNISRANLDNSSDKQWKTKNANIYLDIIKLTVHESNTLSDNTKKEVLEWFLSINSDGSKCESSCSKECASTNSRKSGIRLGGSDLEPNLEIPMKRRKLTEPSTVRQEKRSIELENQPRIDQCFPNIHKTQQQITKDPLSGIENLPKTPVKYTENVILSRKDSYDDKTPDRKSTPVNSVPRKNIASPKRSLVAKTPATKNLDKSMNNEENVSVFNVNAVKASNTFQNMFDHEHQDLQNSDQNNTVNKSSNTMDNLKGTTLKNKVSHQRIVQEFSDSEYDTDDSVLELIDVEGDYTGSKGNNESSDSPSDSSESDIEEIVITKVKVPVKSTSVEQSAPPCINMQPVRKSFLASLSNDVPLENADPKAVNYRTDYKFLKEELCKDLYALYNEKVFDNRLPKDMQIEWSVRFQRTAGKYKCSKSLEKASSSSRILLSTKILDSPNRLRDVLIHEMCHAATRLLNNVNDGHGSIWRAWASKAVEVFPELPTITRCHSYETQKKFIYKCTCCGHSFGRHRRSFDINRKVCGYCHGPCEILIKNVTKAGKVQVKHTYSTKQPKGFAVYVKENFHAVRQRETSKKHAEVIKILKQQFCAVEATYKQVNSE